jgi:Histidine kinase-, DNA gyrase B-, and HSP90-like ATPase
LNISLDSICSQITNPDPPPRKPHVPEDHLATVFERFHQVNATDATERGGTGLGLTIARSIVEPRGVRIWVKSTDGEGTVFSFTLPLAPGHCPRRAHASEPDTTRMSLTHCGSLTPRSWNQVDTRTR